MTKVDDNLFPKLILQEAANDGSDFSNPTADYRVLFLGEDGLLHVRDSAGTVTSPYSASGGISSGTSFPGGPSTNDVYRRTDINNWIAFYDGTRWRTCDTRQITFSWKTDAATVGIAGSVNAGRGAVPWAGTYGLYLLTAHFFVNPLATNNGSHYVTIKLNRADSADSDTQIGSTLSTVADTAGTNLYKSLAINAVLDSGARELKIRTDTGAGAPGGVLINCIIDYQVILT